METKEIRIVEIHKNGINHWYNKVSYYIFDWNNKKVIKNNINTIDECYKLLYQLGYKNNEITELF